jgi:hypothetical protein
LSIAPPSDIVLDVALAADPLKLQAATAKLATMASGVSGSSEDFASVLNAHATPAISTVTKPTPLPVDASIHRIETRPSSPYQKFEAMVLQNFLQSMLPKDSELFGDAFSADAYRSMLADQLATQIAKAGRVGIAQVLEKAHAATSAATALSPHTTSSTLNSPAAPIAGAGPIAILQPVRNADS